MTFSLENAMSLHKCISQIESESVRNDNRYDAFDEDVVISYHKEEGCYLIIDKVTFGMSESDKAKRLIQDYFDEVYNI